MTLGSAAAAKVWVILWCKACGHQGSNGAAAAGSSFASNSFNGRTRGETGTLPPRSDVRCLFPIVWQIGDTVDDNVSFGQTRPDERYKKEQLFPLPRACPHQLGEAKRGRGPGEGPNLIALGATTYRCALHTRFQSENV
jgi:hypothetical protein